MPAKAGRKRRILVFGLVFLVAVLAAISIPGYVFFTRDEGVVYANVVDQFKYGSVGTEAEQGFPYYVWEVLPTVFSDLLPEGEGQGWERFGFLYEPGRDRPIGMTFRKKPIGLVGVNCALCHTSTVQASASSPRRLVLGMPAAGFKLGEYINFLRAVGRDERFDADTLMPAIEKRFDLSLLERPLYRYGVIPRTRDALRELDDDFQWLDRWPAQGPGRVSTFSGWKVHFHYDPNADDFVGTSDFPSIWNQRIRRDVPSHWDGNNTSLLERNISASLAVGATKDSIDVDELNRVGMWLLDLQPPSFPKRRIDTALASRGERIYGQQCASCHDVGGSEFGAITPLEQIGTDPDRVTSFTPDLVEDMNMLGGGKPWAFSHFRKTDGYANGPLDGLWLRAPYLHNGSVPSLRALLFPAQRPAVFHTGYDVYDWQDGGFVTSGPQARRRGFRYDTRLRGNHNTGHLYGTLLPARQRDALIEYLKTK
jgi:mono/diheme cytochrome c family protein